MGILLFHCPNCGKPLWNGLIIEDKLRNCSECNHQITKEDIIKGRDSDSALELIQECIDMIENKELDPNNPHHLSRIKYRLHAAVKDINECADNFKYWMTRHLNKPQKSGKSD